MTFQDIKIILPVITHVYQKRLLRFSYKGFRSSCVKIEIIAQFGQTGRACSVHWQFQWCGLFHIVPSVWTGRDFWSSNVVIIL